MLLSAYTIQFEKYCFWRIFVRTSRILPACIPVLFKTAMGSYF